MADLPLSEGMNSPPEGTPLPAMPYQPQPLRRFFRHFIIFLGSPFLHCPHIYLSSSFFALGFKQHKRVVLRSLETVWCH
jgi:hypothetical protein